MMADNFQSASVVRCSCLAFYDLTSEVTYDDYSHFHHILLVNQSQAHTD